MTNIYEFSEYRDFLENWLKEQPRQGRGILSRWAESLHVHPTLLSQVMGGNKDLSLELAEELARLIHLSDEECEYFLLLVQKSRAGSVALRRRYERRQREIQTRARDMTQRLKTSEFDAVAQAEFYSSWLYSGVRNLTALNEMKDVTALSSRLGLPREVLIPIVEFLLKHGLCEIDRQRLTYGPARTHLPATSPLVGQHHRNWRGRGEEQQRLKRESDLFFTFPMSLSEKDADLIRQKIPKWIEDVHKLVGPSPSETVRCLNIDYFEY